MRNTTKNLRSIFGSEREVAVWSDDGIVRGRAYCKERDVSAYIKEVLEIAGNKVQIVIERN